MDQTVMVLSVERAQKIIAECVSEFCNEFSMMRVVPVLYTMGQRRDSFELAMDLNADHPASIYSEKIFESRQQGEHSSFVGMSVHTNRQWWGLRKKEHILAYLTVNCDEFDAPQSLSQEVYHMLWQVLDVYFLRHTASNKGRFNNGPIIPRRKLNGQMHANLRADIFAALCMEKRGHQSAPSMLAKTRALESVSPKSNFSPQDYPYIIALEAAEYSKTYCDHRVPFVEIYRYANEIGGTFDVQQIWQWRAFAEPAQKMAWRGASVKQILSAAIHTSDNPYVRTTALQVSDLIGIEPCDAKDIAYFDNSYCDASMNEKLHRDVVESTFDTIVAAGLSGDNWKPLIDAAHQQTMHLKDGRVRGWCAHALYAAIDVIKGKGSDSVDAAHNVFDEKKFDVDYQALDALSESIIEKKMDGEIVTLSDIGAMSDELGSLGQVKRVVETALSDAEFVKKLKASNDLAVENMSIPRGPLRGINTPTPSAAPAFTPSAPGLGTSTSKPSVQKEDSRGS